MVSFKNSVRNNTTILNLLCSNCYKKAEAEIQNKGYFTALHLCKECKQKI